MIETIFEALTGLRFLFGNITALFVFFGAGLLFGRLTKNISVLKFLIVTVIAYYGFSILVNSYGALIIAFILGLASNYISFTVEAALWAEDIADFIYASRHPEAFEDIREQEQQPYDEWDPNTEKQSRGSHTPNSNSDVGEHIGVERSEQRANPNDVHFRTMNLDPNGTYSKVDLKRAYRKQALKAHPDTGGSSEEFQRLNDAYQWLLKRV